MYNLCLEDSIYIICILIYMMESNILFQIFFLTFLFRNACCELHVLGWVLAHIHASMCV